MMYKITYLFTFLFILSCSTPYVSGEAKYNKTKVQLIPVKLAINYLNETRKRVENGEIGYKDWFGSCVFYEDKIINKKKLLYYRSAILKTSTQLGSYQIQIDELKGDKYFCLLSFDNDRKKEFDKAVSALTSLGIRY